MVNKMTFEEYQEAAKKTYNANLSQEDATNMAALGLCGEAGEFAELWKKTRYHGHTFDKLEAVKELGDVLWYLASAASAFGLSLSDIAQANIDKLHKRYPDGFSSKASINRTE